MTDPAYPSDAADIEGYARYAVYYAAPRASALADLGGAWLGWDADRGAAPERPEVAGLPATAEAITARARGYGFHATLKAPFRLKEGATAADLAAAMAEFAAKTPAADGAPLAVMADLQFPALRPSAPSPGVDALAAAVVRAFDPFRAPLNEAELAKRRKSPLSPKHEAYLADWGYPYIFDEFHFHMTLGRGPDRAEAEAVAAALTPLFAPHLSDPFRFGEICLSGEPHPGDGDDPSATHFRILRRFALTG